MEGATPPTITANTFYNCNNFAQIIVPSGSLEAYKAAAVWSGYADMMVEADE